MWVVREFVCDVRGSGCVFGIFSEFYTGVVGISFCVENMERGVVLC